MKKLADAVREYLDYYDPVDGFDGNEHRQKLSEALAAHEAVEPSVMPINTRMEAFLREWKRFYKRGYMNVTGRRASKKQRDTT